MKIHNAPYAGPVNNILLVQQQPLPKSQSTSQGSLRKHRPLLPPALAKFENSKDEDEYTGVIIDPSGPPKESTGFSFLSSHVMDDQITELQVLSFFSIPLPCGPKIPFFFSWLN